MGPRKVRGSLLDQSEVKAMAFKNGSRLPVSMQNVFPNGCHLVPGSITEALDYDEATGRRSPAVDKYTGKPVFQCRVSDMDPDLEGRQRETVVKILADRMPTPPTGTPFELVEFDGLQVTPYVGHRPLPGPGPVRGADGVLAARDRIKSARSAPKQDAA
jgi:hypothetical protein